MIDDLTKAFPKTKIILSQTWNYDRSNLMPRETRYGTPIQNVGPPAMMPYSQIVIKPEVIVDLDLMYRLTKPFSVNVAANNLFNVLPAKIATARQSASRQSGIHLTHTE